MAWVGQATAQGALAQCRQQRERKVRLTSGNVPLVTSTTLLSLTVPALIPCHCLQATSHDQHFRHLSASKEKPYLLFIALFSLYPAYFHQRLFRHLRMKLIKEFFIRI